MTAFTPREWQQECFAKAWHWLVEKAEDRHFLINATPGAGKTLMGTWLARELLAKDLISRVVVIAPRNSIVRSWANDFKKMTGRPMLKLTGAGKGSVDVYPDISATWSAISAMQPEIQAVCRSSHTLVVCDEHHHAAIRAAWGEDADSAFAEARYVIALTGTPIRSDGAGMQWFDLEEDGRLGVPEAGSYTLDYRRAIDLGYCRPMVFHRHIGELLTADSNGAPHRVTPEDQGLFEKLIKQPHRRAGAPAIPSYHHSMITWAGNKLSELRARSVDGGGVPDAGGLVAAPTIEMAEYFGKLITATEGAAPIVVHSRLPNAEDLIDAFRASPAQRWLVSVNMISEGVDIPRLRVIVNLASAGTELYFRQLAGRAIRSRGPDDISRAYMVIPEISGALKWAQNYEEEQLPVKGPRGYAPPPPWACPECGSLNAGQDKSCHACGAARSRKPPPPPPPRPVYEIEDSDGDRDGVIVHGMAISETDVKQGEKLVAMIDRFDRKVRPGTTHLFLSRLRPEEMAIFEAMLAEVKAFDRMAEPV